MPGTDVTSPPPALVVVAHGTASPQGSRTTRDLVAAVAALRPGTRVSLAFLDIDEPPLAEVLAAQPAGESIVVPLLLSTGYHVTEDIPAITAGRQGVRSARHLGPHPLLADALIDRLNEAGPLDDAATLLVAAGSSRAEAAVELREAGELLAARLDAPVEVATMADDVEAIARRGPTRIATYLLAEGQFAERLARLTDERLRVAAPLRTHPSVAALVWYRYDEARAGVDPTS